MMYDGRFYQFKCKGCGLNFTSVEDVDVCTFCLMKNDKAEPSGAKCRRCNKEFRAGLKFDDGTCICSECHQTNMMPVSRDEPDNSHYTRGGIEPWTYIQANDLNFFEGSAVKYITRWRHKNGVEDLRKARVYIDELIRQEEWK